MIGQNLMIIDTEVEVPHETTLTTKTIHKTDTVLHLEINLVITKHCSSTVLSITI